MTNEDFSNGFDTLLNSFAYTAHANGEVSGQLQLDEYEKSFFLTKAQEQLVQSLYDGRNSNGDSFERTEEMRRMLSDLVMEEKMLPMEDVSYLHGVDKNSKFFTLPYELWFITYEEVEVSDGKCGTSVLNVYPVTQDEYQKIRKNPFRGPGDRRAVRLDLYDGIVEIVSKYTIGSYYIRYIKKLPPIILVDLPDGLTLEGSSKKSSTVLNPSLHQRILELAVMLALQSRGLNRNNENK